MINSYDCSWGMQGIIRIYVSGSSHHQLAGADGRRAMQLGAMPNAVALMLLS